MNLTEFRNIFLNLEEENNFFDHKYKNWKFWEFIRVRVYYELQDKLFDFKKGDNKWQRISLTDKLKTAFYSLFLSFLKNPLKVFKKRDILIFSGSRRIKKDSKDYDIYFDEFISKCNYSVNVLEDYFQGNNYKNPASQNIAYIDRAYLYQKFYLKLHKPDHKELENLLNIIESKFDVKINRNKIYKFFDNFYIEHQYLRKYFRKILIKASPKVILETVSYGTWKQIFNEEAKKMNIPVIELQHGFMGPYQIPYNFKSKRTINSYPDKIFTFGQFWNETTDFPIDKSSIISCGYPYFEHKTKEYKQETSDKKRIMFISQPTIAEGLIALANVLSEYADENNIIITYKLHPIEFDNNSDIYEKLKSNTKINVVGKGDKDLYYYLANSDVQVGVYSTALIEGLGFNLKTLIADLYGKEWMSALYENNYAHLINSADEIIKLLGKESESAPIEKFWKSNALNNILKSVEEVI